MLSTDFSIWDKGERNGTTITLARAHSIEGPVFRDQMHSVLGSGVFNADGEQIFLYHATLSQ